MSDPDMLAEVEAHAGALHRELVHALQIAIAIERDVLRELLERREMSIDIPGRRVIEAAVRYWQVCQSGDASAMTQAFAALGQAVGAWLQATEAGTMQEARRRRHDDS